MTNLIEKHYENILFIERLAYANWAHFVDYIDKTFGAAPATTEDELTLDILHDTYVGCINAKRVAEYYFDQLHVAEDHETYCDVCGFSYPNEDPCIFH